MSTFADRLCSYLDALVGDFNVREESQKFIALAREQFPGELDDWLQATAERIVSERMASVLARDRAKARARAASRAFAEAAASVEDGDTFDAFHVTFVIDENDTRRRVGDMTGADHRFVASHYTACAKRDQMLAAFHAAVAKKVGKSRTRDVLTADQYDALMRRMVPVPDPTDAGTSRLVA